MRGTERRSRPATRLLPWLFATLSSAALAEPGQFKWLAGLDFSSGRYGAAEDTDVWALPLTAKYSRGPAVWKLSIPYLRMTAPAGTTTSGGEVTPGTGQRTAASGWGDAVAGLTWSLWEQPRHGLLLDLGAKAKLGTGSMAKGLSNGENDYSLFADLYVPAGAFTPFATLGRRWPGAPAGLDPKPVWYGSLGLNWKLGADDSIGAMLDYRAASYAGSDPRRELTAYWSHRFSPAWKIQPYAVAGGSDASPDWGLGVMLIHTP